MSIASRKLQIGDRVTTDFNRHTVTEHVIVERQQPANTGSGIAFRVAPIIKGSSGSWIDADWFEPVAQKEGSESNG